MSFEVSGTIPGRRNVFNCTPSPAYSPFSPLLVTKLVRQKYILAICAVASEVVEEVSIVPTAPTIIEPPLEEPFVISTRDLAHKMKPQFFLSRPNGTAMPTLVPLVPADELPPTVSLEGLSKSLTHDETDGMKHVGLTESRHLTFPLKNSEKVTAVPDKGHLRTLADSRWAGGIAESKPSPQPLSTGIEEQPPTKKPQSFGSDGLPKPLPPWHDPSLVQQTDGIKEYCSYWVFNGQCAFAQAGCRFKHEMPTDMATLNKIGLRDLPEWYRRQHGIRSLLASDTPPNIHPPTTSSTLFGRHRSRHVHSGNWRTNELLVTTDEDTGTDSKVREWTATPFYGVPRTSSVSKRHTSFPKQKTTKQVETLMERQNKEIIKQLDVEQATKSKLDKMFKPLAPSTTIDSSSESRVATPSTEATGSTLSTDEDATVTTGQRTRAEYYGARRGDKKKAGRGGFGRHGRGGRGGRGTGGK